MIPVSISSPPSCCEKWTNSYSDSPSTTTRSCAAIETANLNTQKASRRVTVSAIVVRAQVEMNNDLSAMRHTCVCCRGCQGDADGGSKCLRMGRYVIRRQIVKKGHKRFGQARSIPSKATSVIGVDRIARFVSSVCPTPRPRLKALISLTFICAVPMVLGLLVQHSLHTSHCVHPIRKLRPARPCVPDSNMNYIYKNRSHSAELLRLSAHIASKLRNVVLPACTAALHPDPSTAAASMPPRKGYNIAYVLDPSKICQQAIEPHAKASMWHTTVPAQIQVPVKTSLMFA